MHLFPVAIVSHDRIIAEARVSGEIIVIDALLAIAKYGIVQHRAAVNLDSD